jgi:hypothetical protein
MTTPNSPRWPADRVGALNPTYIDAPTPDANETCPVCQLGIAEGSSWVINEHNQRIHANCRSVVATAVTPPAPDPAPTPITETPTSHLGLARAYLTSVAAQPHSAAMGALAGAVNEIIQHLQENIK